MLKARPYVELWGFYFHQKATFLCVELDQGAEQHLHTLENSG